MASFRPAPHVLALLLALCSPSRADVTFIHWSDIHCNEDSGAAVKQGIVEDLNALGDKAWPKQAGGEKVGAIDFVIATGDLTDRGTAPQWERYLALRSRLRFPSYEAMGNHDIRGGRAVEDALVKLHGATHYSFDKGGVHVVVLNPYVHRTRLPDFRKPQLDWLQNDLAKVRKDVPLVLAMHSPPLRNGSHFLTIGDSVDRFVSLIRGRKAIILHGHRHRCEKHRLDDTWLVLGAGKSAQGIKRDSTCNVLRIGTAGGGRVTCVPYDWVDRKWATKGETFLSNAPILPDEPSPRAAKGPDR